MITVQQVCVLVALTVIKHRFEGENPIGAAGQEWIFDRNLPYRTGKMPIAGGMWVRRRR